MASAPEEPTMDIILLKGEEGAASRSQEDSRNCMQDIHQDLDNFTEQQKLRHVLKWAQEVLNSGSGHHTSCTSNSFTEVIGNHRETWSRSSECKPTHKSTPQISHISATECTEMFRAAGSYVGYSKLQNDTRKTLNMQDVYRSQSACSFTPERDGYCTPVERHSPGGLEVTTCKQANELRTENSYLTWDPYKLHQKECRIIPDKILTLEDAPWYTHHEENMAGYLERDSIQWSNSSPLTYIANTSEGNLLEVCTNVIDFSDIEKIDDRSKGGEVYDTKINYNEVVEKWDKEKDKRKDLRWNIYQSNNRQCISEDSPKLITATENPHFDGRLKIPTNLSVYEQYLFCMTHLDRLRMGQNQNQGGKAQTIRSTLKDKETHDNVPQPVTMSSVSPEGSTATSDNSTHCIKNDKGRSYMSATLLETPVNEWNLAGRNSHNKTKKNSTAGTLANTRSCDRLRKTVKEAPIPVCTVSKPKQGMRSMMTDVVLNKHSGVYGGNLVSDAEATDDNIVASDHTMTSTNLNPVDDHRALHSTANRDFQCQMGGGTSILGFKDGAKGQRSSSDFQCQMGGGASILGFKDGAKGQRSSSDFQCQTGGGTIILGFKDGGKGQRSSSDFQCQVGGGTSLLVVKDGSKAQRSRMSGKGRYWRFWEKSSLAWSSLTPGEVLPRSPHPSRSRSPAATKRVEKLNAQNTHTQTHTSGHRGTHVSTGTHQRAGETQSSRRDSPHPGDVLPSSPDRDVPVMVDNIPVYKRTGVIFNKWLCLPDELWLLILSLLPPSGLATVSQVCQQLYRLATDHTLWKDLRIENHCITDQWLHILGGHCPRSLSLYRCSGLSVTSSDLEVFFSLSRDSLKELNVTSCTGPGLHGDLVLCLIGQLCEHVTTVDVSWSGATDTGVTALANSCTGFRLETVVLNGCQITDEPLIALILRHKSSLCRLEVFGCQFLTPSSLEKIYELCPLLRHLNVGQVPKIHEHCLTVMTSQLTRLLSLNLTGLKAVSDSIVDQMLQQCSDLYSLTLSFCPGITDLTLHNISLHTPHIRFLNVSGCQAVTDTGIQSVALGCRVLQHLDVSSSGTGNRGVTLLANYCNINLLTVKLSFCHISLENILKLCGRCLKLRLLHLYGCAHLPTESQVREVNGLVKVCPLR